MNKEKLFNHNQIFNHILLKPYMVKLNYYSRWGKFHKIGYWIMIIGQLFLGLGLTISLILKFESIIIASFAIALNFMLILTQYIQFGEKYKRYRLTEMEIEFLLLDFANKLISSQESDIDLLISADITSLGKKIEKLILNEFIEHFFDLKVLSENGTKSKIPEIISLD